MMVHLPYPRPEDRSISDLLDKRSVSTQCVQCPDLEPCPVCPKKQACQLSVPPSCAQCAKNACIDDPLYDHHSNAGSIGGAVGGMVAALALAGLLFWLWRRRRQQSKDIMRRARLDAKMRTATAEKFRPGTSREKNLLKASAGAGDGGTDTAAARSRGASVSPSSAARNESADGDEDEADDDELDESDVEWTELREDGLTAYRNKPGQDGLVVQDAALLKRQSVGAATHLSRITEGAEDDDESVYNYRRNHDSQRLPRKSTIAEEITDVRPDSAGSDLGRGHSSSASIGNEMNRARSRKSHVGNRGNPFLDGTEAASIVSSRTNNTSVDSGTAMASSTLEHGSWSAPTNLEAPSRVHRPVGAPLVDLKGKPKSPSYASSTTTGSTRMPLSPASSKFTNAAPNRPLRNADLNLRLADGTEPGKIGDDLLKKGRPDTGSTLDSNGTRSTTDSMQERKAEMYEGNDYPTELANSAAYGQRKTRTQDDRNSILTTNTVSTVGTMEYVMSAPQIISPMLADGAKRMQLKQGKALLVRSLSAIRREQEERKASSKKAGNAGNSDAASSAGGSDVDPLGDVHSFRANTSRSISPAGQNAQITGDSSSDMSVPFGLALGEHTATRPVLAQRAPGHTAGQTYSGGTDRPQSSFSSLSLPFVDQRPMLQPEEFSPTDAAHSRGSMATLGSMLPARNSAISLGSYASGGDGRPNARAMQRQSQTSIAGLSVFDEIPFHLGHEGEGNGSHVQIPMPEEGQTPPLLQSKDRHDSQGSSHTVEILAADEGLRASQHSSTPPSSSPLFHSLQVVEDVDNSGQSASSPFHDSYEATETLKDCAHAQLPRSSVSSRDDLRNSAVAVKEAVGNNDDEDKRRVPTLTPDANGKGGPTNEEFDQIRLRHELDSYPFQVDITPPPR